jgi:vitamin B12 transporter
MPLSPWGRLATCLALAATAARAEPTPTPLPPVQVPLAAPEGLAGREPSSAVMVVELSQGPAAPQDAAEALRAVPGAVIQDSGGAGQRKTLSLRGAAPDAVLVLLDGVPLAAPSEAMDLSRIPTAALARMEVLRGAGSRYGPGAMGGVVNLVTRPSDVTRAFGEVSVGSFLTARAVLGASVKVGPGEGLLLVHGLTSDGSFDYRYQPRVVLGGDEVLLPRLNNDAQQGGALARFRLKLDQTTFDVLAEGLLERRGLAGPVQNPSPTAWQRTDRGMLSFHSSTGLEPGGTLTTLAWGRLEDTLLVDTPMAPGAQRQTGAGAEVTYARMFGRHGLTALVTGGGDWLSGAAGSIAHWGRLGAMVSDEVSVWEGHLSVDAAARVDMAGPFVVLSPKAGATAQLPLGFELKLSAGQASRPPSFSELYVVQGTLLPNPGLRPERGLSLDASLGFRRGAVALTATGFGALYQDLISYEYYPPSLARPFNFAAARVAGLEVEGHAQPLSWLELSGAYTFTSSADLLQDPRYYGKPLPMRPEHQLHGRATAGTPRLSASAEVSFQSGQALNRTDTLLLPARTLVNLGVSCTPFERLPLTVSFDVKNLLDVQSQDVDGYPLPPRAAFLTLGLAWDGA